MNQVPTTPTPKTSQTTLIIVSILAGILILLAGFGAYIWSMNKELSNSSSISKSSINSVMSRATNPTMTSVSVTSTQATNLKTLSCPSFDISVNTNKYKVGFDKFNKDFATSDSTLLESAKKEILPTQSISCSGQEKDNQTLVKFVEKNYELPCWFCGGSYVQSLNLALFNGANVDKVISTSTTKSVNNIEGTVTKLSYESMENKPINYSIITFKIKDMTYSIRTESGSQYPTEVENDALLKDALELFNSIKVK